MLALLLLFACTNKEPTDSAPAMDGDGDGVLAADDCDDANPNVYPGAIEVCDGADNDCDGQIDDSAGDLWYADADGDGYGDPSRVEQTCTGESWFVADNTDCDDLEASVYPGAPELCDEQDNDCDGEQDEGVLTSWFTDADSDGAGDPLSPVSGCTQPPGTVANAADCDDADPQRSPNALELCDGLDNDCDGVADGAAALDASTWYADGDSDGYGDPLNATLACEVPSGFVAVPTDCDDTNAAIHPDAVELCNFADDDCDGELDEPEAADAVAWYRDRDGDGHGDPNTVYDACFAPSGYVVDADDCDDTSRAVFPGATEVCNGVDDDCNGTTDESSAVDASTWYGDGDRDGYGDPALTLRACNQPALYVANDQDCDDSDSSAYPGATEVCDGADNDCDSATDEAGSTGETTWYRDADGDGYGDASVTTTACDQPSGYVDNDEDCDDSSANNHACACTLTGVGSPQGLVSAGTTQGTWLTDPLETLGSGLIWELDGYSGSTTVTRFASQSAMVSRSSSGTFNLPSQWEGTGAVVYDGDLYYVLYNTNTIVKHDISSNSTVATVALPGAGYHNTYCYQWGGYSDIDLAVDEQGLWAIYATSSNSGRIVISRIDPSTMSILATYNTSSRQKTNIGNAFMICGVLYSTSDYYTSSATVDYAFDTATGQTWNPGIPFNNAYSYNSAVTYSPADGYLRAWDSTRRVLYTTTLAY